jgi:hypothetical protein
MYSKLLERKEDYELAVGEFPDIFSESIREEVNEMLNPGSLITSNVAADLVNLRQNFQTVALNDIWENSETDFPASRDMREELLEYVGQVNSQSKAIAEFESLTSLPGTKNSLGMNHEALDIAANVPVHSDAAMIHDLYAVFQGKEFVTFALTSGGSSYQLIKPLAFGRLMKSLIGKYSLTKEDLGETFLESSAELALKGFLLNLANIPQHSFSKTGFSGASALIEETGRVEFQYLGKFGAK